MRCEKCHKHMIANYCGCNKYIVDEGDEMPYEEYGHSFEDVVTRIAEDRNENHVFDDDLFEQPIKITDDNGVTKFMQCYATFSIDYHATDLTTDYQ